MAQLSLADIITRAVTDLKEKFASLVDGVVSVAQGGTGKGSHTSNSVLVGDGTNAVKNVASASGALYATAANGAPQFGTLPVAQGGTGATTAALARTNLDVVKDSAIAYVESTTATANHAVGDYFMLGDVLMRATAAIAAGETINASKATPATVQGQIDTLRDSVGRIGIETRITRLSFQSTDDLFGIRIWSDENRQLVIRDSGIEWHDRNNDGDTVIWRK